MNTPSSETSPATPESHVIVLFGVTGDLAKRKILPGLFHLSVAGLLPTKYRIIGSSRRASAMTNEQFLDLAYEAVCQFSTDIPEGAAWESFAANLSYTVAEPGDSAQLVTAVTSAKNDIGGEVASLFYLSVPPGAFLGFVDMLGSAGLNENSRIICEKPFGTDLASARELDYEISQYFTEAQVFRIDHFLGKESIDNLLALRFANGLFEPIWNRFNVSYVQIDVPEKLSIEGRGVFFEQTGTFRDMVVTHLFQVLGFIAMEQPTSFGAKPLRDEVRKVFETIQPLRSDDVVFGQYEGYRSEPGVDPNSQVETFVALRAEVQNPRWKGVPFYLRTGKSMAVSRQVVTIGFHEPVMRIFPIDHGPDHQNDNELVADFADPGSIEAHFWAKKPGPEMRLGPAVMTFRYTDSFTMANKLEPYERLIYEAMMGNQSLFTGAEGIERLWEIAAPVLENPPPIEIYDPGSWGPDLMGRVIAPHRWSLGS